MMTPDKVAKKSESKEDVFMQKCLTPLVEHIQKMQETNQKMQETTREALQAQREETKALGKAAKHFGTDSIPRDKEGRAKALLKGRFGPSSVSLFSPLLCRV